MDAVMTVQGEPVYLADQPPRAVYEATWARRRLGAPMVRGPYRYARYVSAHVEADDGREIEVSALVDLHHTDVLVEDHLCRIVPDGPNVELTDEALAALEQRLIDAADNAAREDRR